MVTGPRIVYLAREIDPSPGVTGAQRRVSSFVGELQRTDVPHIVVTAGREHRSSAPQPGRAARAFRRLPEPLRGARRDFATFSKASAWAFRAEAAVEEFGPTVVLERARYMDPAGQLLARRLRVPHVLELHGLLSADAAEYYHSLLHPAGSAFEHRRYRTAAGVIVVSDGLAMWLTDHGVARERIAIVPNGVEKPASSAGLEARSREVRRAWNMGPRLAVGWIGRPMPWQVAGFRRLVAALEHMDGRIPVGLVIIGEDASGGTLAPHLSGCRLPVIFAGEQQGGDADAWVGALDLGVIPDARAYDLPVKLFHYGALRIPVLAPAADSIVAFDAGRELMFLFDNESLERTLMLAISDRAEAYTRAKRLAAVVERDHYWPVIGKRMVEFCMDAAAR